jgi:hypothetical protein
MGPRLIDWEFRLDRELRNSGAFAWGNNDCCMFAARVVRAMTGQDFASSWKGYGTAREAVALVDQAGGVDAIVTRVLGSPKAAEKACRGDVVMVNLPRPTLGICVGHVIAVQGADGVQFVPLSAAQMAWTV